MLAAYVSDAVRAAEEPVLRATPPGALMEKAAFALATTVLRELRTGNLRVPGAGVLALVGGGNNGGDALYALTFLARRGVATSAALVTPRPHEAGAAAARAAGVRLVDVAPGGTLAAPVLAALARSAAVWLDGMTGIGARGALREPMASAVRTLAAVRGEAARAPLAVAVDVPSGIGVDDGTVAGAVLPADITVTFGAAKPGLLLPPAAASAGRIEVVDIGTGEVLRRRPPAAVRLEPGDVADLWPVPGPAADKYTRGVLGVVAGSARYPGAGVLAVAGALATGVGMVRYRGDAGVLASLHPSHPEVVGAAGRVQAWALGSGVDPRDEAGRALLQQAMRAAIGEALPVVLDAGALALLQPGHPAYLSGPLSATAVLTPHAGELAALLDALDARTDAGAVTRDDVVAAPARWARWAARETGATVLLKGHVTVVAPPEGPLLAQDDATPWLATAGAGDVLAGVLGALLAGRSRDVQADPGLAARIAAAAAHVHGRAAWRASGGGPISAGDVARRIPGTVRSIMANAR